MSFADPGSAEKKRAELERLLADQAGRLIRASQLAPPEPPTRKTTSLQHHLGDCTRIGEPDAIGTFLHRCCSVPVKAPTGPIPARSHPRGYSFCPEPANHMLSQEQIDSLLHLLTGDEELSGIDLGGFAFLDAETTGAAGPAGTLPFMIGLGYFSLPAEDPTAAPPAFHVEQFFVEDYCHEPAMLEFLRDRLDRFDAFVTFNGKSFDIPLLRARYILNRIPADLDRPHFDLLHSARRVWKQRLGSCSLSAIEQQVLGLHRTNDVPGSMVPMLYFDFLRGIRPMRLLPVFDHNVQDIISMGAMMLLLAECTSNQEHPAVAQNAHDLASLGRLHLKRGQFQPAVDRLETALCLCRSRDLKIRISMDLATVYRKLGRMADAATLWREQCARDGIFNVAAHIEMVKLLEHALKDPAGALQLIHDAETQFEMVRDLDSYRCNLNAQKNVRELMSDFAKRKIRLAGKISRKRQPCE